MVAAQLETLEQLQAVLNKVTDLREQRIRRIEGLIERFRLDVATLRAVVAPDETAGSADPEEFVLDLKQRLQQAQRGAEARATGETRIAALSKEIGERDATRREAFSLKFNNTIGDELDVIFIFENPDGRYAFLGLRPEDFTDKPELF